MSDNPASFEMEDLKSTQNPHSEILRMKALDEFNKLKPPLFDGRSDSSSASTWLDTVKTMFEKIGVLSEYRVAFAAYLFEGPAEDWWDQRLSEWKFEMTSWVKFDSEFRSAYVTGSLSDQDKLSEFQKLQQTQSVAEYRDLFVELCRYDPFTMASAASKCARFRGGLKLSIRSLIEPFEISDFDVLVDVALQVEADRSSLIGYTRQLEGMKVANYHVEFFVRYLLPYRGEKEADRVMMWIRFMDGLCPEIKSMLRSAKFRDFNALFEAAKRAELVMDRSCNKTAKEPKCTNQSQNKKQKKDRHMPKQRHRNRNKKRTERTSNWPLIQTQN